MLQNIESYLPGTTRKLMNTLSYKSKDLYTFFLTQKYSLCTLILIHPTPSWPDLVYWIKDLGL